MGSFLKRGLCFHVLLPTVILLAWDLVSKLREHILLRKDKNTKYCITNIYMDTIPNTAQLIPDDIRMIAYIQFILLLLELLNKNVLALYSAKNALYNSRDV